MGGRNTARESEYIETLHGARTVRATPSFRQPIPIQLKPPSYSQNQTLNLTLKDP